MTEPQTILFPKSGAIPNNPRLPVLIYTKCFDASGDGAATIEALFDKNGWPPQWRNGVFEFHHYHSTAHEVLGFAVGRARLILGGPGGQEVEVRAGDVALLPAGTGHFRQEASRDFLVVGAYPPDQSADLLRGAATAEQLARIASLPFPVTDPVEGANGGLTSLWQLPAQLSRKA
jgi:uncharacterized protein YjlB